MPVPGAAASAKLLPQEPQVAQGSLAQGPDLYDLFGQEDGFDYDETVAEDTLFESQDASYSEGTGAELKGCILRRCNLRGIRWKRASFTDVIFENCDLSNARFAEAYFQRVKFVGCKMVGADMVDALLRNTTFSDCVMRMINLNGAKLTGVRMERCEATEAAMRMLQEMKRVTFDGCDFTRAEMTNTHLKGLDLTTCRLAGLQLTGAAELRGAYVTSEQAIQLSSLLGIILKD